jgi:hypothetical protein
MHRHVKKKIDGPNPTAPPPPSDLARQPRRVHTASTAPATPAAVNSASSGEATLKWQQNGHENHAAAAAQQRKFDLANFSRPPSARRGSLQSRIARAGAA